MRIEVDGIPYPTRYGDLLDSCPVIPSARFTVPIHEAAHAVVAMTEGHTVVRVELFERGARGDFHGQTTVRTAAGANLSQVFFAAGERAADRWVRENSTWTPELAVAIEVTAFHDRMHYAYLDEAHDAADEAVDSQWAKILSVAEALYENRRLSGRDVSDIVRASRDRPSGVFVLTSP